MAPLSQTSKISKLVLAFIQKLMSNNIPIAADSPKKLGILATCPIEGVKIWLVHRKSSLFPAKKTEAASTKAEIAASNNAK